jgi:hypothetical protein
MDALLNATKVEEIQSRFHILVPGQTRFTTLSHIRLQVLVRIEKLCHKDQRTYEIHWTLGSQIASLLLYII